MPAHGNAPVVVRRKKVVVHGGHHGGAWKVAYADFVTAMMAFFLLMWLLGATSEDQRRGLADYFNPTIPVKRTSGGGDGAFGGDSVMSEDRLTKAEIGGSTRYHAQHDNGRGSTGLSSEGQNATAAGAEAFDEVQEAMLARSGESMISDEQRQHMLMRVTDEGLVVELFDLPERPLFTADGRPEPILKDLVRAVGVAFGKASNQVAIKGFVRAVPVVLARPLRFETLIARAETLRHELARTLDSGRIERVTGYGDRHPVAADPTAVRNNRIELVLLR